MPAGLPTPVPTVELNTQFGTEEIPVGSPAKLCLPAGKNGEPTPGPEWPHLKCYNIVGRDAESIVNLETQFGVENNVGVGKATLLCIPVTKRVDPEPPATPTPAPTLHYECYDIPTGPTPVAPVTLETQFGTEALPVGSPTKLCAPALKNGEGNPSAPDLKCYSITGPDSGKIVHLTTQFGAELGIPVLAPSLLCVPANKEVLPTPTPRATGVGGIAEPPDVAGAPAEEAGGSGWSAGGYAALAGGLAAAVVVLSAGWWYARRRFNRS